MKISVVAIRERKHFDIGEEASLSRTINGADIAVDARISGVSDPPAWTLCAGHSFIAFYSGAQLFTLGIIGEYLARIHFRTSDKPAHYVREQTKI